MATSRKTASKRSAKKSAGKASGAKKAAKKTAKKTSAASIAPKAVKTGRGASPGEVGAQLVSMFNRGEFAEIERRFWSPAIVSIEGEGVSQAWRGRKAVDSKNEWWMSQHRILGASAEGPFVGATGFAVRFRMDVETIATGERQSMDEVGVYTVKNGKIVQEEFMYGRHA